MKTYSINLTNDPEEIPMNYYTAAKKTDSVLIFVGGSGDDKDKFNQLIDLLIKENYPHNILTYTYRGLNQDDNRDLGQLVTDLEEVVDFAIDTLGSKNLYLFCTSIGAYPTCFLATNDKYQDKIRIILMFDPADYYLKNHNSNTSESKTSWKGFEEYNPDGKTASELLKGIKSKVITDVINLTIRNYGSDGYSSGEKDRGKDNPQMYARINNKMVKTFFKNIPTMNKGIYIEDNFIPHGFARDGDIQKNFKKVAQHIKALIP